MKENKVLKIGFIMLLIGVILFGVGTACTENERAKTFGGKMTVMIENDQKFVNATWKDSDLWVLTRQRKPEDKYDVFKFVEKSTFGVLEGEITFIEKE